MKEQKSQITRDSGFISIEEILGSKYIVHRSLAGSTHFKGLILPKVSKISISEKTAKVMIFHIKAD